MLVPVAFTKPVPFNCGCLLLKVVQSADVNNPRLDPEEFGKLKVWVAVAETILKSLPLVPVANACVEAVRPLRLVRPEPPPPEPYPCLLTHAVEAALFELSKIPIVVMGVVSEIVAVPTTFNFAEGVIVPMPTLPVASTLIL